MIGGFILVKKERIDYYLDRIQQLIDRNSVHEENVNNLTSDRDHIHRLLVLEHQRANHHKNKRDQNLAVAEDFRQANDILKNTIDSLVVQRDEEAAKAERLKDAFKKLFKLYFKDVRELEQAGQDYGDYVANELKADIETLEKTINSLLDVNSMLAERNEQLEEEKEQLLLGFHYYKGLVDSFQDIIRGETHAVDRSVETGSAANSDPEATGTSDSGSFTVEPASVDAPSGEQPAARAKPAAKKRAVKGKGSKS